MYILVKSIIIGSLGPSRGYNTVERAFPTTRESNITVPPGEDMSRDLSFKETEVRQN